MNLFSKQKGREWVRRNMLSPHYDWQGVAYGQHDDGFILPKRLQAHSWLQIPLVFMVLLAAAYFFSYLLS